MNDADRINHLLDLAKSEVSHASDHAARIKADKAATKEEKAAARARLVAATQIQVATISYASHFQG